MPTRFVRNVARAVFGGVSRNSRSLVAMIGGVLGFRAGLASLENFQRIFQENELVNSAIGSQVRALITIPIIAEYWAGDAGRWGRVRADDGMQKLLDDPNPMLPALQVYERFWQDVFVAGNGLLQIKRETLTGRPTELWNIDANTVVPKIEDGALWYYIFTDGSKFGTGRRIATAKIPTDPAKYIRLPARDVIHLVTQPDSAYPLWGLSCISPALVAITEYDAIHAYIISFFQNGAVPAYAYVTNAELTDDEAERIVKRWNAKTGGVDNSGGGATVTVVDGTEGTFQRLGLSTGSREIGLHDLGMDAEARVLAPLNVPPIIVGASVGLVNSTYSNYGQAREAFYEETVDPNLQRRDSVFTKRLASQFPGYRRVRADKSHVMALEDLRTKRTERAAKTWNSSLGTRNESRGELDMLPVVGGDVFMVSVQQQTAAMPDPNDPTKIIEMPMIVPAVLDASQGSSGQVGQANRKGK